MDATSPSRLDAGEKELTRVVLLGALFLGGIATAHSGLTWFHAYVFGPRPLTHREVAFCAQTFGVRVPASAALVEDEFADGSPGWRCVVMLIDRHDVAAFLRDSPFEKQIDQRLDRAQSARVQTGPERTFEIDIDLEVRQARVELRQAID